MIQTRFKVLLTEKLPRDFVIREFFITVTTHTGPSKPKKHAKYHRFNLSFRLWESKVSKLARNSLHHTAETCVLPEVRCILLFGQKVAMNQHLFSSSLLCAEKLDFVLKENTTWFSIVIIHTSILTNSTTRITFKEAFLHKNTGC